jgi:hypothetical protein
MARLSEQARGVIDFSPAIMLTDARESAYASEDVRQQREAARALRANGITGELALLDGKTDEPRTLRKLPS